MKWQRTLKWSIATLTTSVIGITTASSVQASVVKTIDSTAIAGLIDETIISALTRNNSVEVAKVNTKLKLATDKARAQQKREEERKIQQAKEDAERKAKEAEQKAKQEAEQKAKEAEAKKAQEQKAEQTTTQTTYTPVATELQFGANGLLVMQSSGMAQRVVNLLLSIPGHANGAGYHQSTGLDNLINQLSTAEAVWVLHRIEGAGFGQTGDGYAGMDTPASHRAVVTNQINRRFGGSIHALLRSWGTYSYGGY